MRLYRFPDRHRNTNTLTSAITERLRPRLFLPDAGQHLRVPPLAYIGMALDPVPKGGLSQRLGRPALAEGELAVVHAVAVPLEDATPLLPHVVGDLAHADRFELLELGVAPDALEEGDGEARALPRRRREHAVRRAGAHALRQRLERLADGHHQRAVDGRAVDPLAVDVLDLQAAVVGCLEEVAREHCLMSALGTSR